MLSSKIEGTLASLEDLNRHEVVGSIGKKDAEDIRLMEVVNYVKALEESLHMLEEPERRISLNILRNAHRMLMEGVRGHDKNPGKFRDRQNWIIKRLGTRRKIVYTPPPESLNALLENLEEFVQTDYKHLSVLIQ